MTPNPLLFFPNRGPCGSTDVGTMPMDSSGTPPALQGRFDSLFARVRRDNHAFLVAGGTCARCRDTGRDHAGAPCTCPLGDPIREAEYRRELAGRIDRANIAPFAGRTLASWGGSSALTNTIAVWDRDWPIWRGVRRPFLLLHGSTGNGKTSLASAILLEAMIRSGTAGWRCVVPDLLRRLRPGEEQDDSLVGRAIRVPLLVLDDLGVDRFSEWVETQLYTIINARYEHERWTVITTNLSPDDGSLNKRLGDRLFWRIHERSLSIALPAVNLRDR